MATTVEVIFSGIVYLAGSAASGRMDVVLPNVSAATAPYSHAVSEHTAYLKIQKGHVTVAASDEPDFKITLANEYWIYTLKGEEIKLSAPNMTPDPLEICKVAPCKRGVIYDKLIHKKTVCEKCGKLDTAFKDYKNHDIVAATMAVTKGVFSAEAPNADMWAFKPAVAANVNGNYPPAATVSKAAILYVEASDKFLIDLRDHKNNLRHIELNDGAKVYVENMPLGDLVSLPAHCEAVDHHFALFYTLLMQPIPSDPLVPHRVVLPDCDTLGPRQNCPPLADEEP